MYYSNIANEELQYFHHLNAHNFSISLSDIIHKTEDEFDNRLFKVEQVTDAIYKVFPLFYTNKITSTNPADKIFDTQCIICQQTDKETYITFIRDENEEIKDYKSEAVYYSIEDTLSVPQFNGIVSLLRKNEVHTGDISLRQEQTIGKYGKYTVNLNSTTITDEGVVITDETISNLGTVKLENPVFPNSTYTLQLTVTHITDVNVCEISDENIVEETLSVVLNHNERTVIPFDQLAYNYIVKFDAKIIITHDKPIIHYYNDNILLSASENTIHTGSTLELTAQTKNMDNTDYKQSGNTIYFFKEEI